jgi:glucose-6-phosphate isomerase
VARLRLDYTRALSTAVGPEHGVTPKELESAAKPSRGALRAVQGRRTKDLRWLDLPYQGAVHEQILDFAARAAGRFQNVVVLGIGGSALGTIAVQAALNSPYHNLLRPAGLPRLFVLDNVDPDLIGEFLEQFEPSECLFNVISKSGGTAETMAQLLIFRQRLVGRLGEAGHAEHVVVTTGAEGVLRRIAEREGYASFAVPEGVGGRYSVLSPVGLLPLALAGIDIVGLVKGAAFMDEICRAEDAEENPALVYAALQWLMQAKKHKPIAVSFAYSQRLVQLADWYAQLLAESLGKRVSRNGEVVHAGPTPVRALGVTDQHSQVQLYAEGPFDKWFTFLAVEQPDYSVEIPAAFEDLEGAAYLGRRTLEELFRAEYQGTRIALTEARRPNVTLSFPSIEPHTVGQYLQLMEVSVALMGEHYDVDAFDQPGVEAGKIAAYALMGRRGYEKRRAEIEAAQPADPRVV